jgi:type VI protein secretion system component VasF
MLQIFRPQPATSSEPATQKSVPSQTSRMPPKSSNQQENLRKLATQTAGMIVPEIQNVAQKLDFLISELQGEPIEDPTGNPAPDLAEILQQVVINQEAQGLRLQKVEELLERLCGALDNA